MKNKLPKRSLCVVLVGPPEHSGNQYVVGNRVNTDLLQFSRYIRAEVFSKLKTFVAFNVLQSLMQKWQKDLLVLKAHKICFTFQLSCFF